LFGAALCFSFKIYSFHPVICFVFLCPLFIPQMIT
jgi:hypothetical protein